VVNHLEIFDDLVAEQARIDAILRELDDDAWTSPSAAVGWSIADVVLHLAQTNEVIVRVAAGDDIGTAFVGDAEIAPGAGPLTLDDVMDLRVKAERAPGPAVLARWQASCRDSIAALRAADPQQALPWAAAPLKPATLATTRLAEHWAHGLDIAQPLGAAFPDTDRLRHVAWLAHGSLPYAFAFAGEEPHPVFCELTAPDGATVWRYGPSDADSTLAGAAGAFCRVGAQRMSPEKSGLVATGPYGAIALRVVRNYAG